MEDNGKRMLSWDIVKGITILIMMLIKDSLPQFRAAGKRKGILHLQCGEFSARI